ncbi:MAG: 6,7-dimethyl-8-ribityllumazine synthase, partial [Bacteroidetes bacterium]|nr:6,7-dimethyl-8-ribityllumazine synthase [Bacteroidota bacterium]
MSSANKNLSQFEANVIPNGSGMRIGIVVAEWNIAITGALRDAAVKTLLGNGVLEKDILVKYVPGSFELTFGAQLLC